MKIEPEGHCMIQSTFIVLVQSSELQGWKQLGTEQLPQIWLASITYALYGQNNERISQICCTALIEKSSRSALWKLQNYIKDIFWQTYGQIFFDRELS